MSLLKPTVGELIERQIVLRLKLAHTSEGAFVQHFQRELNNIDDELRRRNVESTVPPALVELLQELHTQLWDLVQTDSSPQLLKVNLRRHGVREEIDKFTGEYRGPEKV